MALSFLGAGLAGCAASATSTRGPERPVAERAPPAVERSSGPTATSLLERATALSGGRSAWRAVAGMHAEGWLERPPDEPARVELWTDGRGRYRVAVELAPSVRLERGRDADGGWSWDPARGARRGSRDPGSGLGGGFGLPLLDPAALAGAELLGRTRRRGGAAWVIGLGPDRLFVAEESGRWVGGIFTVATPDGPVLAEVDLDACARRSALWLCAEQHAVVAGRPQRLVFDRIELGPVPDGALAAPPEVGAVRAYGAPGVGAVGVDSSFR